MNAPIPAVVLGGTGYVAGELLRLLAAHPRFELACAMSDSQAGEPIAGAFPHLASAWGERRFAAEDEVHALLRHAGDAALFCAAPHGAAAALLDRLLTSAAAAGSSPRVVDISADFRFRSAEAYAQVYGHAHGAPHRLGEFTCAPPELLARPATRHVAHPGCFATAILLASVPLLAAGIIEPRLYVSGVTGSTGSGRRPVEGTHHPLRHGDLYGYSVLVHRHVAEVAACAEAATGVRASVAFVPHSGPYARGIHVTVQAQTARALDTPHLLGLLADYYAAAPFVRIGPAPPRVKDVACSNYAHLSAVAHGGSLAVLCTLDNLTKGAAGGAVQWMNRLHGLDERTGLTAPAPGWI